MKLKQVPDDFQVEEVTSVCAGVAGPFAFYRLDKTGWTTVDALQVIRRRWQVPPSAVSYGGLKDRHAVTAQYLTVFHGPRRNLTHQTIHLRYLGQVEHAFTSADIQANRFRLTLRDLQPAQRPAVEARLEVVRTDGVPNYFDDQRFGSVGPGGSGEFIGRLLVRGQFEDALRLALAGPYEFDRADARAEKRQLSEGWGNWDRLKDTLPRGHARSLVDYLRVHPGDFKGAMVRLRPELRGLYLSAYQSHLWNRILARWLTRHCRPEQLRPLNLRLGPVPFPAGLDPDQRAALEGLSIPLPSSRWKPEEGDARLDLVREVLAEEKLELRDMQVRGVRDLFFSKGERPALSRAGGLHHTWASDDRNKGKQTLTLTFELGRGSYATLIVKAVTEGLTAGAGAGASVEVGSGAGD